MARVLVALVLCSLCGTTALAQDRCDEAGACGDHGRCFEEQGRAHCLCQEGFVVVGVRCVESDPRTVDPDRARRRSDIGERVAELARAQVGRRRGTIGSPDREHDDDTLTLDDYLAPSELWCADFVSWVYATAGAPLTGGAAGGWLVTNNRAMRAWFRARGRWIERRSARMNAYVPSPGDFVRLPTPSGTGHAALVADVRGNTLYLVEGNVGGEVTLERYFHYRDNPRIEGFGIFALPNAPPTVRLLPLERATVARPTMVRAEITDDGPAAELEHVWSVDPPYARLVAAAHRSTAIIFERPGRYTLRMTARDEEHEVTEQMLVTVEAAPDREPPTAHRSTGPASDWSCAVIRAAPSGRGPAWLVGLAATSSLLRRRPRRLPSRARPPSRRRPRRRRPRRS